MPHRRTVPFLAAAALACLRIATAQCQPQWLPGDPYPTPVGIGRESVVWDPDAAGPLSSVLVVAGALSAASSTGVTVATFDGATWSLLGTSPGTVRALAVHNGQLHAAREVNGISYIEMWNGASWQQLGAANGFVYTLASHSGQLFAGGNFTAVNGVAASRVARWNGTAWTALGTGLTGAVYALESFNGALYAGGALALAGTSASVNLASWNGTVWTAGPDFNDAVYALAVRNSIVTGQSFLFVGGAFGSFTIGSQVVAALSLARFEPSTNVWTSGGLPGGGNCWSLLVRATGPNGYELLAGKYTGANQAFWRFSGGSWSSLGSFEPQLGPRTIAFYGGRYTVGIDNAPLAQHGPTAVRAWNGTAWQDVLGGGIAGAVQAVERAGADLVVGGAFPTIAGVTVNHVARGSPGAWTPLGTGVEAGTAFGGTAIHALATAANGDVVAGGNFTIAGGTAAANIARWNGVAWSPLGAGTNAPVLALLVLPGGDVVAGGNFTTAGGIPANHVARWTGSTWLPLGAGCNATVRALTRLDNDDIVAGGYFTTAGGFAADRIARFSGGSWYPLGTGCNDAVFALATAPNGDLFAGGLFTNAGGLATRVARWGSGTWSATQLSVPATTPILSLLRHPGGDLFVGTEFFSTSAWSTSLLRTTAAGTGEQPVDVQGQAVNAMRMAGDDLVIAGRLGTAGGIVSSNVARLDVPCPAVASAYGSGCSGLTAPLALTSLQAPWLGTTARLRASTFGPGSLGVHALGVVQLSLPLPSILPGSLPGCMALVGPDFLEVLLPSAGAVEIALFVPPTASLAGAQLHQQVVQLEAVPGGLAFSTTNGMQITVGTFF